MISANQSNKQLSPSPIENEEEKPLDPAVERVRRKLMRFMFFSILITMLCLGAVIVALIIKVKSKPTPSPSLTAGRLLKEQEITLQGGDKIISQALHGDLLCLEISDKDQQRYFLIYNYKNATLMAKIKVKVPL